MIGIPTNEEIFWHFLDPPLDPSSMPSHDAFLRIFPACVSLDIFEIYKRRTSNEKTTTGVLDALKRFGIQRVLRSSSHEREIVKKSI
jgi:hypothetical protein